MPVKYNEYIKKPDQEFAYGQWHIEEIEKCMSSLNYFLQYVNIVHPDYGRINFKPRDYQQKILDIIDNNRFSVFLCSRQSGKCVCGDILIKIRNKKTKKEEYIKIEDFFNLFDGNNK